MGITSDRYVERQLLGSMMGFRISVTGVITPLLYHHQGIYVLDDCGPIAVAVRHKIHDNHHSVAVAGQAVG